MINKSEKYEKTDSWVVALFLAESSICTSVSAFINIPFISVFLMLFLLFVIVIKHKGRLSINLVCGYVFLLMLILLGVSLALNGFENTKDYILYYIVFGITSFVLCSLNLNYKQVFTNIISIYFAILLVYFLKFRSSFIGAQDYWSSQMGIAYSMVIPALFTFAYIFYKKKLFREDKFWYFVLSIVELVSSLYIILFDCGTRGAIVSVIIGWGLLVIGSTSNYKTIWWIIVAMFAGIILIYNREGILSLISQIFLNSRIRSLRKYAQMLSMGTSDNGRLSYYKDALSYFKESPVLGKGIGYFEKLHKGTYVHEVLFEILCEYGLVGIFVVAIIFFRFIRQIIITKVGAEKIFIISLLGIASILLYSSSYWLLPSFWFTFFIMLSYRKRRL